jgi:predicted nucleotidyltransferase
MPVRSLSSSVLKWPDAASVQEAVRGWAKRIAESHPGILRVGYFGSYARGDWGVGSDLDVVIVTSVRSDTCISGGEVAELPVPADVLVYDQRQFDILCSSGRFGKMLHEELVWVYP